MQRDGQTATPSLWTEKKWKKKKRKKKKRRDTQHVRKTESGNRRLDLS